MDTRDGYVCIRNSQLLSGRIGKGLLGGDKGGLFSTLAARYSPAVAGLLLLQHTVVRARCSCMCAVSAHAVSGTHVACMQGLVFCMYCGAGLRCSSMRCNQH